MTEGPPDRQPAISLEVRQTVGKVIETQAPVKTLNSAKDILPIGSSQFGREADKGGVPQQGGLEDFQASQMSVDLLR